MAYMQVAFTGPETWVELPRAQWPDPGSGTGCLAEVLASGGSELPKLIFHTL